MGIPPDRQNTKMRAAVKADALPKKGDPPTFWQADLPYPPSVNHYYQRTAHGMIVGKRGMAYRQSVWAIARKLGKAPFDVPVVVEVAVYFPTVKRTRDLDNLLKCLLDALTKAQVYGDDSLIEDLRMYKAGQCDDGKLVVRVEPI